MIIRGVLIALLLFCMFSLAMPVKAVVYTHPDITYQIDSVEVYRDAGGTLDSQEWLVVFDIEYTADPGIPLSDTFVFRLYDDDAGAVVSTTTAYDYNGYDYGIASISIDADFADLPTWSGNYTMFFEGNPALSWTGGVPPTRSTSAITWHDEGSVNDAQDRLTTRLRYLAQKIEDDWGGTTDLIEETVTGRVLTTAGEAYFTNSIDNLRDKCPDLFYQSMEAVEFDDDVLVLDYHAGGEDAVLQIYGVNWYAQTFTASDAYHLTGVQLPLYRILTPGTITVSLRTSAVNVPTGANLISGTYDGDTLTTAETAEWVDIAFTNDYLLTSGSVYSIVVQATGGDAANYVGWLVDTDDGYSDGNEAVSTNNDATWTAVAGSDCLFELLVHGGASLSLGHRYELRLRGTIFDMSQIATNWGLTNMWVSTMLWLTMTVLLMVAVAMASNVWDCWFIILALMATYGWRAGFADTYFLIGVLVVCAIGIVYGLYHRKAY